jgi:FKBP-type peptidyl-prolyl cis-trans isomerase SlyD
MLWSFLVNIKTFAALTLSSVLWAGLAGAEEPVGDGKEVSIEYTLTLDDGSVADSNVGDEPFVYVHGTQQLLPGLEAALAGLSAGEAREVRLSPEEAYGPVDPAGFQEVPVELIPEAARTVGEVLVGMDPDGQPFQVRVTEVREDVVVVDFNHPLAGQALNFAVKILAVN